MDKVIFTLLFIFYALFFAAPAFAIVDPLSVPNNRFGIHIISGSIDESSPAAQLVNNKGDWGYITFLIESKDRNHDKWQTFFNDLRRRHLIPIVRLATKPVGGYWERPYEKEYEAWADFLDRLNWPVKNRYVVIYNEPNHGAEWGGVVDAKMYAKVLDQTITALKSKNRDFFVLNGGFDASAPSKPPQYEDELSFLQKMNEEVPGIFNKLDGWVSHSYPNPEFRGSPNGTGRRTIRTYLWEQQVLRELGVNKSLPIFITETGWKHAEGLTYNPAFPPASIIATYYQQAFENAWNNSNIVTVTPFLLNYQEHPFEHFSFKRIKGDQTLAASTPEGGIPTPEYYPSYYTLADFPKTAGKPVQERKAELKKGEVYTSIVSGEVYNISLVFENVGQSIWDSGVKLIPIEGGNELGIQAVGVNSGQKVEPGSEYIFNLKLQAPESGIYEVALNLFENDAQFDTPPLKFTTEVKSPVVLKIKTTLKWKKDSAGDYVLTIKGPLGENSQIISLNSTGESEGIEARYLLPDYTFEFILERAYYRSKTITQKVQPGENILDFKELQPALLTTLLNPPELWKLLPFSN